MYYILSTVLPDCLTRLETESTFRSIRTAQPGSGEFLDAVLGTNLATRPRTLFAFYDRVATSDSNRYLTAIYELVDIAPDPVDPTWRNGSPNYELTLRKIQTLNPPIRFGQAAPLWGQLETTQGRKIQAFFANSRVLLNIPQEDFEAILNYMPSEDDLGPAVTPSLEESVEAVFVQSPTERFLEDYLVDHLADIELGLEPFDPERVRQYPTGDGGRIDIFCRDQSGNLVVVELKKTGAREEVVGQLCRYMGWVMEAMPNQTVRGIIVANVIDARLKYAARPVPNVKLVQYHIHFTFNAVNGVL